MVFFFFFVQSKLRRDLFSMNLLNQIQDVSVFLNRPNVVVCVFLVQFDGGNWERSTLPHTDQHRRTGESRTSPPSSKATSLRKPSDLSTVLGERVDPVLPLEQQVYVLQLLFISSISV